LIRKAIQGDIDEMTALNGDNLKQDYRKVVGDNPNDITDTKYGNNNVMGPDKEKFFMERTLQELLQVRNNNIGGDGIANNVEILTVRSCCTRRR
jgi:hypothetical protein